MRLPDALQLLILILAAYRLTRLGGWDDWPPIYKIRAWIIGERWVATASFDRTPLLPGVEDPYAAALQIDEVEIELPGKQPSSDADFVRPAYDRPLLAHLIHCPFCLGWWVSLGCYAGWLLAPKWSLYLLLPFAISGAVGVIAKNLDA